MIIKKLNLLPLALLAVMVAVGCKKQEDIGPDLEYQTSIDHSIASAEFSSIANIMEVEGAREVAINGKADGFGIFCTGSVTTVTVISPTQATLLLDFGSGATCADGRLRTGKLLGTFTGKWKDAGSYVDIIPTDYTVNGYAVDFNMRITFNGTNGAGHKTYTTTVDDATLVTSTGTISWVSTRETEWIAGDGDFDASNNEYLVTGTASGTARSGIKYDVVTDQALLIKLNCPNITQGKLSITPQGYAVRTIDYGTGACDKVATLTIGSYSTEITLP